MSLVGTVPVIVLSSVVESVRDGGVVVIILGKVRSEDHPHHQVLPLVVTICTSKTDFLFLQCLGEEGGAQVAAFFFYSSHAWN